MAMADPDGGRRRSIHSVGLREKWGGGQKDGGKDKSSGQEPGIRRQNKSPCLLYSDFCLLTPTQKLRPFLRDRNQTSSPLESRFTKSRSASRKLNRGRLVRGAHSTASKTWLRISPLKFVMAKKTTSTKRSGYWWRRRRTSAPTST